MTKLGFIETLFKKLQLLYMKPRVTVEKIDDFQLFFHPKNTQSEILTKYSQKIKKIKI